MSAGLTRLVVALAVAILAVVELVLPAPVPGSPVETDGTVVAGTTVCAAMSGPGSTEASVFGVAGPAVRPGVLTADVRVESAGEQVVGGTLPVTGTVGVLDVDASVEPLVVTRWRGAPVVTARSVRSQGDSERPGGLVEGRCPAGTSNRWVVPGVATAGGASATLHLANPLETTATAVIRLTTPAGLLEPARLSNIVVPAHDTLVLDLGEFAPEEPDLGVIVDVVAGRLTAEAVQRFTGLVGDVAGASLVRAEVAGSDTWTVPYLRVAGRTSAWVWVTNAGERATDVRLVLHTQDGPRVPLDSGLTVAPGETRRLSLTGVASDDQPFSATVTSDNGEPIHVSGAVARALPPDAVAGELDGVGVAVVPAARPATGAQVGLASLSAERTSVVHVTNPGDAPATVRIALSIGGLQAPSGVEPVTVAPGARAVVELDLTGRTGDAYAVVVTSDDQPVVVALEAAAVTGPLDLVVEAMVPFAVEAGVRTRSDVVADPALVSRTGSGFGPAGAVDD